MYKQLNLRNAQENGGAYMNKCFTLKHFLQVLKVIFTLAILGMIYSGLCNLFGEDSFITKLFFKNFLFKAYNIVGLILIILFSCGIWLGRAKSKKLFTIVSGIMLVITVISYIPNVISFFDVISEWFKN